MWTSHRAGHRRLLVACAFSVVSLTAVAILVAAGAGGYARAAASGVGPTQYQYGPPGNPSPGTAAKVTTYSLPLELWQVQALALEPGVAASGQGNAAAWIGDASGALVRVDLRTGAETLFSNAGAGPWYVQALALGPDGRVWFLGSGQLGVLDPRTGQGWLWEGVPSATAFAVDRDGHVWVPSYGGYGSSVGSFDPRTGVLTQYEASTITSPSAVSIRSNGDIWWCNPWGGIGRVEPKTGLSTSYDTGMGWSYPACNLSAPGSPSAAPVWVATDAGGIGRLDPLTGNMSVYYGSFYIPAGLAPCSRSVAFTEQWSDRLGLLDPGEATPDVIQTSLVSDTVMTVEKTELTGSPLELAQTHVAASMTTTHIEPSMDGAFRFFEVGWNGWRWGAGPVATGVESKIAFVGREGLGLVELPPTNGCGS